MNLYKLSIAADINGDQITIFQRGIPVRYDIYLRNLTTLVIRSTNMCGMIKMVSKTAHEVQQERKKQAVFPKMVIPPLKMG